MKVRVLDANGDPLTDWGEDSHWTQITSSGTATQIETEDGARAPIKGVPYQEAWAWRA